MWKENCPEPHSKQNRTARSQALGSPHTSGSECDEGGRATGRRAGAAAPPPPTHTPERLFNPSPLHKEQESTRSVCLCLPHIRTRPSDLGEEEVIGGS